MNKIVPFLMLLWFSLLTYVCQSQTYLCHTEKLSVEDGLSSRFTRSIVQDSKGFIWIGTNEGLNRYDGKQFNIFTTNNSGLQSNFINKVYEDADNNIWAGHAINNGSTESFSGIDLLDINTFNVQSLEEKVGNSLPFKVQDVYKIYSDSDTKWLYLITSTGHIYIYKGKGVFELYFKHEQNYDLNSFLFGNKYNWVIARNEILMLDKKTAEVYQRILIKKDKRFKFSGILNDSTIAILHSTNYSDHRIITVNHQGYIKEQDSICLLGNNLKPTHDSFFKRIKQTGVFLYQSRDTIVLFDELSRSFYGVTLSKGNFIRTVFVDKQGNIWVGSSHDGLIKISCQRNKFTNYFKGFSTRGITTFNHDSLLLVDSYHGLHLYDFIKEEINWLGTGNMAHFKTRDRKGMWMSSEDIDLRKVYWDSILERKNAILPSIEKEKQNSLYQFYAYKSEERRKKGQLSGIGMNLGWSVYEDSRNRTWIGTTSGIGYLDQGEDSLHVFWDYNEYEELASAIINYFHENEEGLWVATSIGLYLIDLEKGAIKHYAKEKRAPFKLPFNHLLHIHEDKNGLFWMATRGGGIIQLNPETGRYKQLTTNQGLSHNLVYAILEDEEGLLWMSSNYGLMCFDPNDNSINTYLPKDGISHEEFNHTSYYQASNGMLYFGGLSGVTGFNPSSFSKQTTLKIPLQVIRYQYFDGAKSALVDRTQNLLENGQIVLDYTDRFFVLDLALLDFRAAREGRYAYKIEGLDQEWNFIETNSIRINGLLAGEYTLLIKGEGNDGIWSSEQLKIPILVKQPFYLTWQFFLLLAFVLIVGIFIYARWREVRLHQRQEELEEEVEKRTKKIEQQAEELRELDNLKSRFFANISHELRTPLTLILGPVEAILEEHYGTDLPRIKEILRVVKRNGLSLQSLIEEILVLSKLEAQSVELEEKALFFYPLIRRLFLAFEAQAHLQKINFQLNYHLDQDIYVLLDESKFEKILNNLLSNALKYTPRDGSIQLNVAQEVIQEDMLYLDLNVIDSGKGIHPQDLPYIFDRFYQSKQKEAIVQGGAGIGLALAFEFSQLLGGGLTAVSQLGKGSTFSLKIPIKLLKAPIETAVLSPIKEPKPIVPTLMNSNKKTSILIVEDNEDMRMFIADLLGSYYHVVMAANGRIGLDILKENTIHLIVSDVMMPEMDGFELLKQVKMNAVWKQLPMIMLTARATEQDKLFALRIGVDDYLQKPFSREELLVRVANLLQNYHQRKIWQELEAEETLLEEKKELIVASENASISVEEPIIDEWMKEVERITKREVGNSQFGIISLAYDLNISERHLRRKIKLKTGLTPNQYFRCIKLDVARQYLESQKYATVSEVAYKVGFSNAHYFSKIYREQFGKKPIDYLK